MAAFPTETEALLGSPEAGAARRSRDKNVDPRRVRWITHSLAAIATLAVALAVFSSDARGWAVQRLNRAAEGEQDPRPFIVDFGDSVSPSFRHQAFVYRCQDDYDLHTKLTEMNHHGMFDYYRETQVTAGEPAFGKCYQKHFSSSFGPKPVFFSEMAAHKGKMIGMFRMPAQKIAAGFVNAFESCPTMQHEHGPSCNPAHESYAIGSCDAAMNPTPQTVEKYFNCVKGCQARMLTGRSCHDDGDGPVDVAKAVTRVQNNFIYAGITSRFEQSVRDFHRIIGAPGEVPPEAFERSNPQRGGDRGQAIEEQVAAAEAAIGLAILVVLFRNRQTINVDDLDAMKG